MPMRKILKVLVVTLMFSFLIMPFCVVPQPKDAVQAREASPELSIKADSPFNITANADFDLYDSGGNGQPGTPWILENYVINASGLGVHGILINNTDAHFILRNCTVTGTETGYAGIWSENITNGIIQNNTIVNNYYGIYLVRSSD
ncbi:MAG: right-handed parallel beta-helix repeat-containing protein, partial [Candidatus Helarchaeota archaeon]|nr:right-handed parallel beta-helix repeat-containing protein [Candidatus Helarchaeota archaeon]